MRKLTKNSFRQGFTLLECLFAIMLIGVAVSALVAANGALTMTNGAGVEISTAEFLVEQIRELTDMLPATDPDFPTPTFGCGEASIDLYDDVDDFDNVDISPPISSDRQVLSEFSAYSQKVIVVNVNPSNLDQVVADNSTDFLRVTVTVSLSGTELSSASWIRARY